MVTLPVASVSAFGVKVRNPAGRELRCGVADHTGLTARR
jgi:hypothetical protein